MMGTIPSWPPSGLPCTVSRQRILHELMGIRQCQANIHAGLLNLPADEFSVVEIVTNALAAGAPSRTPLGELTFTALPKPLAGLGGGRVKGKGGEEGKGREGEGRGEVGKM